MTAHAPYNFIPLVDGEPLPGTITHHDHFDLNKNTGYFDVELKTVTPLFVRGMLTNEEVSNGKESKDNPQPFILDGKPVIPGSSLRGMLRNLVEIITFGKMHFVSDDLMLYRSVFGNDILVDLYRSFVTTSRGARHYVYPNKNLKGGYLIKDSTSESGWAIQPAVEHNDESFVLIKTQELNGIVGLPVLSDIWVQPAPGARRQYVNRNNVTLEIAEATRVSTAPFTLGEKAVLILSQTVGRRHWYPAIFEQSTDPSTPIPRQIWNTYKDDRDMNRGIPTRKLGRDGDPLFYLVDGRGKLIFFGPTMFFRLPYENSVGEIIDNQNDKLQDPNFTDYADAMFGYVSDRDKKRSPVAYAGRISVTSGTLDDEQQTSNLYEDEFSPKILSSPKPTTFQHYLEPDKDGNLRHYGLTDAKIRGHKLYWRQDIGGIDSVKEKPENIKENDTQHTCIKPLQKGVEFTFRVYFENLTDAELGALAWALTLGDEEDAYHMIGMGKPYGLGVVKLTPTLLLSDRIKRYCKLFDKDGKWHIPPKEASDYIQAFKDALDAHGVDFETDERIKQLRAMLRLYEPDGDRFSYMQIEPVNEYEDRPVLPYPSEIEEEYDKENAELESKNRHKKIKEERLRIRENGLQIDDIVEGKNFDNSDGIWFDPTRVIIEGNDYKLDTPQEYEAFIPPKFVLDINTQSILGRIVEIEDGDPICIICKQIS
jgi:CRISPR-associated protein (TIGR03986 family)